MDDARKNVISAVAVSLVAMCILAVPAVSQGQSFPQPTLTATAGDGQVTLTWSAARSNERVVSWIYGVKEGRNFYDWKPVPGSSRSTTTYIVTGLNNGTRYRFKVMAVDGSVGGPRSNVAFATPARPPGPVAPANLTVSAGYTQVTLSWDDPDNASITGYEYRSGTGATWDPDWTAIAGSGSATTSHTVMGLTDGTRYTVEVRAIDDTGSGQAASLRAASGEPLAPVNVTWSQSGTTATVSWDDADNAALMGYDYRSGTGATWDPDWTAIAGSNAATTTHAITGLTDGTRYTVEVRAKNDTGTGQATDLRAVAGKPLAPVNLSSSQSGTTATLAWAAPDNASITGYQIRYAETGTSLPLWSDISNSGSGTTSHTVTGLMNETSYTIEVRAINAVGSGPSSSTIAAPATPLPLPPGNFTASAGNGAVALSWDDPNDDTITAYEYRYWTGTTSDQTWVVIPGSDASTTSHTVTRLTNCSTYTFEVRARNAAGAGPASSVTGTPGEKAAQVTGVTVVSEGAGTARVTWVALSDATVTGYRVVYGAATSGATSDTVDVSGRFTTDKAVTGLTNCAWYKFEVLAVNCQGDGAPSYSVTVRHGVKPAQVTGVSVTGAGDGEVSLSWDDPGDASISGFQIIYGGATSDTIDVGADATSHAVTGLTNCSEYTFKVLAVNCKGDGPSSASVTGTPGVKPAKATGLTVASVGDGTVSLSWDDPGDATVTGYKIAYSGATSGTVAVSGGSTTSQAVTGLTNCGEYTFTVLAVNCSGDGPSSDSVTGTPGVKPAMVTGLAVASVGDGTVSLSWDDPGDATVTGYKIAYSGATSGTVDVSGGSTTSQAVTGLTNCSEYTFTVLAVNCSGDGPSSASVTGTPGVKPAKVTGTSVTGTSDGEVSLSWDDPGDPSISGFQIIYGGATSDTIDVGADATSHAVTGLTNCSDYTFKVLAVNCKGDGPSSDSVTGTPGVKPAQVTGVTVGSVGDGTVSLSWNGLSDATVTGYKIAYSGAASDTVDVSGRSTTSHSVTGLTNCSAYTFEVLAVNCVGDGPSSAGVTGTPGVKPAQVTGTTVTGTGDGTVSLSWNGLSDASITGYQILYSGATSDTIDVGADATSHAVAGLTNCEDYTFKVLAVNCKGDGDPSASVTTKPGSAPAAVTGLRASAAGTGKAKLTWTRPGGTISWYQYKVGNGQWTNMPDSGPATTEFTVDGLTDCTAYTFHVRAENNCGFGGSDSASGTSGGTAPGAVTGLRASAAGTGEVRLTWTAPSGTISRYQYKIGNGQWKDMPDSGPTTTAFKVTGLAECSTSTFQVRAENSCGFGGSDSANGTAGGSAPGAVRNLSGSGGNGQVTVNWNAPTQGPVRGYKVKVGSNTYTTSRTSRSYTITGLDECTDYAVKVIAYNNCGDGASSRVTATTGGSAPGAVTNLSASAGGEGEVTLSWTKPSGTIRGYQYKVDDGEWIYMQGSGPNTTGNTVRGLDECTVYTIQVRAANRCGPGGSDSASGTSGGSAPGAVTNLSASAGGEGEVTLSWTKPSGTIRGYQYKVDDGEWIYMQGSGPNTTGNTVRGLDECTVYTIQVRAANRCGPGGSDSASGTSGGSVPGAVRNLGSTPGNGQVTLNWSAPTQGPVRGYKVRVGSMTHTTSSTSYTVTGLNNCTAYTIEVVAHNNCGDGSSTSTTATPRAPLSVASIPKVVASRLEPISTVQVRVSGGCAPYTYTLSANASSAGLSISSSGVISGTPGAIGSWTITVSVSHANGGPVSKSFEIIVAEPLVIGPILDFSGQVGVYFSEGPLDVSGGQTPYSYSLSGAPPGLGITNSGVIQGTPTTDGYFDVTLTVTDNDGRKDSRLFGIDIPLDGDFNGDGRSNSSDAALFASKIGLRSSDPGFDRRMDLNGDGIINFADGIILSGFIEQDTSDSASESDDDSE